MARRSVNRLAWRRQGAYRVLVVAPPDQTTWFVSRWVYLRILGLVFLAAFLTLAEQGLGILGAGGLSPAGVALEAHADLHGWAAILHAPSVFWISSSDWFIAGVLWGGVVLSGLLVLNVSPRLALGLLWLIYLSLTATRPPHSSILFFNLPPDHLILELSVLTLFLVPGGFRPGLARAVAVPAWVRWLLYVVLFKVMFGSGIVKIVGGQDIWLDFTALFFDHETRPHPTFLAAYAKELPIWVLQACVGFMFIVELVVPFFYFVPGRLRRIAAVLSIGLLIGISLTGNYRWFPLTNLALVALVVDDRMWLGLRSALSLRRWRHTEGPAPAKVERSFVRRAFVACAVVFYLTLGCIELAGTCVGRRVEVPGLETIREGAAQLHLVNTYALFGHIRKERRVIVIEGSADGRSWQPFVNAYNPGPVHRAPGFAAPFYNYLDFLLWMSAYFPWDYNPAWVAYLADALLNGYEPTYRMFEPGPWTSQAPPRFVRGRLYIYRYADSELRTSGQWWDRELVGPWMPTVTLDETGKIQPVVSGGANHQRGQKDHSKSPGQGR